MAQARRVKTEQQNEIRINVFHFINSILREIGFWLTAAIALGMIGALVTYSPADPAWTHTANVAQLHNLGGTIGAWFADITLYFFGYAAYLLPLGVVFAGWRLFKRGVLADLDAEVVLFRVLGFAVALATVCGLATVHLNAAPGTVPSDGSAGGLIGTHTGHFLIQAFGFIGGNLFMGVLVFAGFTLGTGLSWVALMDGLGHMVLRLMDWIGALILAPLQWSRSTKKNYEDDEDDEDDGDAGGDGDNGNDGSDTYRPSPSRNSRRKKPDIAARLKSVMAPTEGSRSSRRSSEAHLGRLEPTFTEPDVATAVKAKSAMALAERLHEGAAWLRSWWRGQRIDEESAADRTLAAHDAAPTRISVANSRESDAAAFTHTHLDKIPATSAVESKPDIRPSGRVEPVLNLPSHDHRPVVPSFSNPNPNFNPKTRVGGTTASPAPDMLTLVPVAGQPLPTAVPSASPAPRARPNWFADTGFAGMAANARAILGRDDPQPSTIVMPNHPVAVATSRSRFGDVLEEVEELEDLEEQESEVVEPLRPVRPAASITTQAAPRVVAPNPAPAVNRERRVAVPMSFSPAPAQLPPLDLLDQPSARSVGYSSEMLEDMSRRLEVLLKSFGIEVQVVAVEPGPVITRFEVEPAPGVKVSQITNLAKDLARGLSVIGVRVVEIIPGKSVIGLEIPNQHREIVYLREVLEAPVYEQMASPLTLSLGKDIGGNPVVANLGKMPHLLVAGTTGSGKSVAINAMLLSLLYKAPPSEVRLILVDPKMLELSIYEDIPHLLTPVVTDMKEAANALRWCVAEMERRYRLMATLKVRNIAGFNRKVLDALEEGEGLADPFAEDATEDAVLQPLPFIVVVIDELADMMMIVGKKVEELIARLAQKARAAGIHLILATQRPSVDVITGLIKANIPTRIAFQVSSRVDSRTILDQMGAEQLLGHGDMLYLPPGTGLPQRVHGAFVNDDEVTRVVDFLRQTGAPDYIEDVLVEPCEESDNGNGEGDRSRGAEDDPLYDEAVRIVTESRRASVSGVQRRLRIGYNRAARLVEEMEASGVVGPLQSNGSREVLAPPPP